MTITTANDTERQHLLSKSIAIKNAVEDNESETPRGEDEGAMPNLRSCLLLGPITVIVAISILWLAFTGFVVVPPGELAVVVTLVSLVSQCAIRTMS